MSSSSHYACIYDTRTALLENAIPFIESGLSAGEPVLVVTSAATREAIASALPPHTSGITFEDAPSWYDAPGRAMTRYVTFWRELEAQGATSLRIVGEPLAAPIHSDRLERWEFFENAVNRAVRDYPFTMMCTYDASLEHVAPCCAQVSHPYLAHDGFFIENAAYVPPSVYAQSRIDRPLHVPAQGVAFMQFSQETTGDARHFIQLASADFGLDAFDAFDFVVAAGEAIANAVEHGGGSGSIRLFASDRELVCDVQSDGLDTLDPLHGYEPPAPTGERGRGIWMMRQLCDWVELRPHADGNTIRLHKSLPPPAA